MLRRAGLERKNGTRMPVPFLRSGGAEGIRTPDLLTASQARSQLRHSPRNADELKVLRLRTGTVSPLSSTLLYPAGAQIVKGKIPSTLLSFRRARALPLCSWLSTLGSCILFLIVSLLSPRFCPLPFCLLPAALCPVPLFISAPGARRPALQFALTHGWGCRKKVPSLLPGW